MGKLDGKTAIVTGASRGLGRDIAVGLAAAGANVVAAARTNEDGSSRIPGTLANTVADIESSGGSAIAVKCDVTQEADIQSTIDATLARYGQLDILVNNAGVMIPGATAGIKASHWELVFRVNVHSPFHFTRAALPHLIAAGGGHVINISSTVAIGPGAGPYEGDPSTGNTAYGSTKAALERFSQGLASELFDKKISVNALSPHLPIWSEGGHFFREQGGEPDYSGWRMKGDVIGDAAVVIATQEPGVFTGNILYDELVMRDVAGMDDAEIGRRYPVES